MLQPYSYILRTSRIRIFKFWSAGYGSSPKLTRSATLVKKNSPIHLRKFKRETFHLIILFTFLKFLANIYRNILRFAFLSLYFFLKEKLEIKRASRMHYLNDDFIFYQKVYFFIIFIRPSCMNFWHCPYMCVVTYNRIINVMYFYHYFVFSTNMYISEHNTLLCMIK